MRRTPHNARPAYRPSRRECLHDIESTTAGDELQAGVKWPGHGNETPKELAQEGGDMAKETVGGSVPMLNKRLRP